MKKINEEQESASDWDDILNSIDMTFFPMEYISRIVIKFENETVWDIDIDDSRKNQSIEDIEDSLDALFEEYDEQIVSIDFRLDVERVKTDLSKRVTRFLKTKK